MLNEPFFLTPIAKTALWGGQRLREYLPEESSFEKISELWMLSVREQDQSILSRGSHSGETLAAQLGEKARKFPLLIKLIDARDRLSVQVHPDDALAAAEGDQGKTEMWHILEAAPGAELIYGLKPGRTVADLQEAVAAGRIDTVLHHQPVQAGETYFIPAGMIHGIGAGILVAEIQQNSDLTYRIYDYDRTDANGNRRPLHIEKGLRAAKPFSETELEAIRFARGKKGLVNCPYFYTGLETAPFTGCSAEYTVLLGLAGVGTLKMNGNTFPFKAGECCYLPAGSYTVDGNLKFLEIKE